MANDKDTLMDLFLFESTQLAERAELLIVQSEKTGTLDFEAINEIFRVMHSIKSSSAMMGFNNLSETTHLVEDLFFYIRENNMSVDIKRLGDIVLMVLDYIKGELNKIKDGEVADGKCDSIHEDIRLYLSELTGTKIPDDMIIAPPKGEISHKSFSADYSQNSERIKSLRIYLDEECQMESLRAFTIANQLQDIGRIIETIPGDLENYSKSDEIIKKEGILIRIDTEASSVDVLNFVNENCMFIKRVMMENQDVRDSNIDIVKTENIQNIKTDVIKKSKQSYISVNVEKLDKLMDIVGELVISELMVTKNPEITKLKIKSFTKASSQLKKMTSELQDIVMSIRMVPIAPTFHNMMRIVRDMSRKLNKDVTLEIRGEDTEVDKNVIESISDPLIHIIRNSIDHGIEMPEDRVKKGKSAQGKVILEARHEAGDVYITVRDDGKGLDREAILEKATKNGLVYKKEEELTDKEVWSFILMPGFSTNDNVTEYSGRGVGMDVVINNLDHIGGKLQIESEFGKGTTFTIKIPLTLAIMDGMEVGVGNNKYTIPTLIIKEAIQPVNINIIKDDKDCEMFMLRGECVELIRIHRVFNVETNIKDIEKGIILVVENDGKVVGLFADKLIGEHQIVVKPIPKYIEKIDGVSGCTILGDGSISLIVDIAGLVNKGV